MSFSKRLLKALAFAIIVSLLWGESGYMFYGAESAYAATKKKLTKKKTSKSQTSQQSVVPVNVSVGSSFMFGKYEQDNNESNGKEVIEWIVLEKTNNRALVVSRYVLDNQPYNNEGDSDWGNCSLRRWLNNTFIRSAFSASEQSKIPTVKLKNYVKNIALGEKISKSSTQDKIFLLSEDDVYKYFASDAERQCKPTVYARAQGLYTNDEGYPFYWLRDLCVRDDGYADYSYFDVHDYDALCKDERGIRPAMYINF